MNIACWGISKQLNLMNKWKKKVWTSRCHEGYADVAYEDVWNLDGRLAEIIANHLRAFLKAEKGPYGGTPGIFVEKWGEKAHDEWLNIIRKMIYAFEEYLRMEDKFYAESGKNERIEEGMQLFIDYYPYLRI